MWMKFLLCDLQAGGCNPPHFCTESPVLQQGLVQVTGPYTDRTQECSDRGIAGLAGIAFTELCRGPGWEQ